MSMASFVTQKGYVRSCDFHVIQVLVYEEMTMKL